jgi:hypothetical protein
MKNSLTMRCSDGGGLSRLQAGQISFNLQKRGYRESNNVSY